MNALGPFDDGGAWNDLPPTPPDDDELRTKKERPVVSATFIFNDGKESSGPITVSHPLPTPDYPLEKAFAFLAAEAAEKIKRRKKTATHHD